jgi:hypothetical protein
MVVPLVPSHVFRNPSAAASLSAWLASSQTQPQERALVGSFLQLFMQGPPRPQTAVPAIQAPRPAPAAAAQAAAADDEATPRHELTATGVSAVVHRRPCTADAAPARIASGAPAAAAERPASAGGAPVAAPDWVTTNEQFYGFREMYPDIYASAAAATKARPAPNLTFKSAYSDSLKAGSGDYWKQFLCTTYETTNQAVHKPNRDAQAAKEAGFFTWMQKQRLYYGEYLSEGAAAKVDAALAAAGAARKSELLAAARLLFAVVRPEKCAIATAAGCLPSRCIAAVNASRDSTPQLPLGAHSCLGALAAFQTNVSVLH